jgi:hypothetical protein
VGLEFKPLSFFYHQVHRGLHGEHKHLTAKLTKEQKAYILAAVRVSTKRNYSKPRETQRLFHLKPIL